MKDKILVVYTGGTICSFLGESSRELNVSLAKSIIVDGFAHSNSSFAPLSGELFEDSHLGISTLSENLTVAKQKCIIENIKSFDLNKYAGVIVLHGTDTLAYTASLFSMFFYNTPVPVMLVSSNKPPNDPETNAVDNFKSAVDLIMNGIAPNVYAPYRNSDGIVYLHIASTLMQCANFSEDFFNASHDHVFPIGSDIFSKCKSLSDKRASADLFESPDLADDSAVLLIHPYVGLDYSSIDLSAIKVIVHGTYHSGTVCVERNDPNERYGAKSILHLADRCREANIPIYAAPCVLSKEQYSSAHDAVQSGVLIPLNMTNEAAYAKAFAGISCGYSGDKLTEFMKTSINSEILY